MPEYEGLYEYGPKTQMPLPSAPESFPSGAPLGPPENDAPAPQQPQHPDYGSEQESFGYGPQSQVSRPHDSPGQGDPDAVLQQYYSAVQRAQLSPAEELRAQTLQRSLAGVQEQVDNGILTAQEGRQLQGMIQQLNLPLQARRSQLPLLQMRLNMQLQMRQHAHQQAMQMEAERFRAQTAQQRLQTVQLSDGRRVDAMTDAQGRLHIINEAGLRSDGANQQRETQRYQQQLNQALRHYEGLARQDLRHWEQERRTNPNAAPPDWYGSAGPENSDDAAVRRYAAERAHRHLADIGIQRPNPEQSQGAGQSQVSRPPASPEPAGAAAQPAPEAPAPAQPDFAAMRRAPNAGQAGRLISNLERVYRRYGSVEAMPAEVRERYVRTVRAVQSRTAHAPSMMDAFRSLLQPSFRPDQLLNGAE